MTQQNQQQVEQPGLPVGRFAGREAFREQVRAALDRAAADRWHEIIVCDPDFADWPLGDRQGNAALNEWARCGGRFVQIACEYEDLTRRHARFVTWRQRWSHLIECRVCRSADRAAFPSAIWSPHWMLQRFDLERCVGVASTDPQRRLELREALEQWLQSSAPGFAATTLGL